jgi:rhomboid domain-containing protein 1
MNTSRSRDSAAMIMFATMLWQQIERLPYKPPITLALIALQAFLFFSGELSPIEFCLNPLRDVTFRNISSIESFARIFFSPFIHADNHHLYYNQLSFLTKGVTIEQRYGSVGYLLILIVLTITTQVVYITLCLVFNQRECGIGFSGVIFALKVLCTFDEKGYQLIYGIQIPLRFAAWVELLAIHFLVPRSSFIGHLAGILAGLLFITGEKLYMHSINRQRPNRQQR